MIAMTNAFIVNGCLVSSLREVQTKRQGCLRIQDYSFYSKVETEMFAIVAMTNA